MMAEKWVKMTAVKKAQQLVVLLVALMVHQSAVWWAARKDYKKVA
jgi:hypothetical protein